MVLELGILFLLLYNVHYTCTVSYNCTKSTSINLRRNLMTVYVLTDVLFMTMYRKIVQGAHECPNIT